MIKTVLIGTNGLFVSENISLDTKIMSLFAFG